MRLGFISDTSAPAGETAEDRLPREISREAGAQGERVCPRSDTDSDQLGRVYQVYQSYGNDINPK